MSHLPYVSWRQGKFRSEILVQDENQNHVHRAQSECAGGPARIGRVTFSKSGQSVYYRNQCFQTLSGRGYKANYFYSQMGEYYWISGFKKRGNDRLFPGLIEINPDIREEYWSVIRDRP